MPFFHFRRVAAALTLLGCACFHPLHAQVTDLSVETVIEHTGMVGNTNFAGMTTYRIYANLTGPNDYLGAVYGNAAEPVDITSTTTFYQHPAGGSFGTDLNPFFLTILPDLAYDSWLTIGLDVAPVAVNEEGISSIGMNAELSAFESGANFLLNSSVGGSWFVLPGSSNGYPDENLRVLLAQVTTSGLLSGTFNVQCFIDDNPFDEQLATFSFGAGAPGCTDSAACNFDPEANSNDGTCWYAPDGYGCDLECLADSDGDGVCDPFEIAGCEDPASCNYAEGVTDLEVCEYPDAGYDCAGACLADADGDGVCDPFEVAGCMDEAACNYVESATDEDGSCEFPVLYYDCTGACLNDADGDGICNELEFPGCTDENADNYFPIATDDDGSCFTTGCMDAMACDYDAAADTPTECSYPDAGYDCAGVCLVDADGDGVCDAFEIIGCTNPLAENYEASATEDSGTCVVLPPSYCGAGTVWDATAGQCVSDGSGDGGIGGLGGTCFGDFDADGQRGTSDLLMWLAVYGYSCD